MTEWLAATITGAVVGLLLYGCVRLRMAVGPMIRERYGEWARKVYWLATILVMVVLANLGLRALRIYLGNLNYQSGTLILEIWFALLALTVAMALIFNRLYRGRN